MSFRISELDQKIIKRGASFRWSFAPNSEWASIETATIEMTHSTLHPRPLCQTDTVETSRNAQNTKLKKGLRFFFFYRMSEIIKIMAIESECINEWFAGSPHGSLISLNPLSHFCPSHFSRHFFFLSASTELMIFSI